MDQVSNTARAVWFVARCRAELCAENLSAPAADEVQVAAICSLVSAGSEMNLYRGEGNLPSLLIPKAEGTLPFPVKFGYQVVGEVVAAGARSGYAVGDRVFCMHPHQERFNISASEQQVYPLPPGTDPLKAAFMGLFTVALHCHLEVPVRVGECVAVSGLGTVGTFSAYLARLTASRLILVDPLPQRRARAAWMGADAIVAPADVASAVQELTRGRGLDKFIETSGAPAALQTALENTGELGTITVAAWYGTRQASLRLSPEFHLRSQKIVSVWVGHLGISLGPRWQQSRAKAVALQYLARIDVNHLLTHRLPFARAAEAYRLLDEHQADTLAVLLDYKAGGA